MKEYLKSLKIFEKAGVVPLVLGASGWGKSDGVRAYAKETDRPCLEFYASMIGAEDIGGFPFVIDGVLYRANDYALEEALDKPVVLFLDEINQARPDVINAMFPILRERKVNNRKLNDDTFIVCAGNEIDDNPYLTELPPAFVNRTERIMPPQSWKDAEEYLANKYGFSYSKMREIRKISEVNNPARLERIIKLIKNGVTYKQLAYITTENIAKSLLNQPQSGVSGIYEKMKLADAKAQELYDSNEYDSIDKIYLTVAAYYSLTEESMKLVPFFKKHSGK